MNFLSSEFLNLVAPYVPGAGNLLLVQEIRLGARRFLKETRMLWQDVGPHSFNAGEYLFAPSLLTGLVICGAENVRWLGARITEKTREQLNAMPDDWTAVSASAPTNYLFENEATMRIYPKVQDAVSDALTARLFLRPSMDATGVEDRVFEHYGEAISAAAIASLLAMRGKPWSDIDGASYYEHRYREMKGDAKIAHQTDFTGADIRVSMRPIA